MKKIIYSLVVLTLGFLSFMCKSNDESKTGSLSINFKNMVGDQLLELNTKVYQNPSGQNFTVLKLKYYISNIILYNSAGKKIYTEPNSYHLIDESVLNSKTILVNNIPLGFYDSFRFSIGVDSVKNNSTDNIGDLDPNNDMAWGWNTGYKFVLMEGKNNAKPLVFHIGENKNFKTLTFSAYSSLSFLILPPNGINISNKITKINIKTDIQNMFKYPNLINFDSVNNVMGGPNAQIISNNYVNGFFTITSID